MIATSILGSLHDDAGRALVGDRPVEAVELEQADRVKRIQRVQTSGGREVGLRLPAGTADLRDGDILALDPDGERVAVVARVRPADVLVIAPRSLREMGQVAHTLGNRHLPAQFFDADSDLGRRAGTAVMVVGHDHTVVDHLDDAGVPYERADVALDVPLRHAEHTH